MKTTYTKEEALKEIFSQRMPSSNATFRMWKSRWKKEGISEELQMSILTTFGYFIHKDAVYKKA